MVITNEYFITTSSNVEGNFVVVKQNGKLKYDISHSSVFHGIGYWTGKCPENRDVDNIEEINIVEVWIPWNNIRHVESLIYSQRS